MNILIVEDEPPIANALAGILKGISNVNIVQTLADVDQAKILASSGVFDAVVIDIMLGSANPKNGIELAREIRSRQPDLPLIMITGHHTMSRLEEAFAAGANDYIRKPFHLRELQLRVLRWLTLSHRFVARDQLVYGPLSYSLSEHVFRLRDEPILLTRRAKALLLIFLRHKEQLLGADLLQMKLWGDHDLTIQRNIRSNIQELRALLPAEIRGWIQTVRGQGYIFHSHADPDPRR